LTADRKRKTTPDHHDRLVIVQDSHASTTTSFFKLLTRQRPKPMANQNKLCDNFSSSNANGVMVAIAA
jgi:hypothetical protein